jgi:hypothetical protein
VPCTSAASPAIMDSQIATQFDDRRGVWGPLLLARMELANANLCHFRRGDWIPFEGRVRGVPVLRGRAEIQDDMSWTGKIELNAISSVLPPETAISTLLAGYKREDPFPIGRLVELHNASKDPAERREISFLIGTNAVEVSKRSKEEQALMVSYLEMAALEGHPVAMYMVAQLAGLPDLIYKATANEATSSTAHQKLDDALQTPAGAYLFRSAEANYFKAVSTFKRAERFGLVLSQKGITLSDIPTVYNVDAAVNARLQERSLGSILPAGLSIQNCDDTWCHVAGGSKFRMTVNEAACNPTGAGAASCMVTARFILTNDLGDGPSNWQKQFMSMTTNAAQFNFSAELAVTGKTWKIVRMQ